MRPILALLSLVPLALAAPAQDKPKANEMMVRSLDDLAHVAEGAVVQVCHPNSSSRSADTEDNSQKLKRVKRCEVAAAAPDGAIVNKRAEHPDCEDVPTFITNW
ncbi:hypothetical protein MPH_12915 [Macrophomina phaseolina MS6]|uniref:Uncharacterized protein n=1 Tax=Macrophomina phaseolina (strain MS6) TaxID=1126212 RepID=K2RIS7_MACPH|nr:hypothetical protein MPH_12915 [Macrophomina phaseolina MS6]